MSPATPNRPGETHARVVCFVLDPEFKDLAAKASVPAQALENYTESGLPDAAAALCFLIATRDAAKALDLARRLRAGTDPGLKPIYLLSPLGASVEQLCDGVVATPAEAWDKALGTTRLFSELDPAGLADSRNDVYRLLGFLYARPDYTLVPSGTWQAEKIYTYPLAEALLEQADDTIATLVQRKLLAPTQLVDRLRHCPKCDGPHLNYIDTCPNCAGIDIAQKPFLHCFTCGHVSPEERFFSQDKLVCPQCATALRHIGADYDRPLENFQCNGCGHVFVDPQVTARCLHCHQVSAPDALIARPVQAFKLTDQGRLSARTGDVEDVFSMLDSLNNVSRAYFESILDWLLALCRRHKEEQFSLVAVRIANVVELTDRIGRAQVRSLMDEFVRRVRELIRTTDLTTRTSQHTLWLLLPKTHAAGQQTVRERIMGLRSGDDSGLRLVTVGFHAPSQMIAGERAKMLLARLEGEIGE
ncbi:MAG: diguanylate cyclase [Desulfobacterales bacterium]|nr:diguanylate cyclase [Desulfobacterales bacterium]